MRCPPEFLAHVRLPSPYALIAVVGLVVIGAPPVPSAESSGATTATEKICLVFSGSRRSELEPCGCHGQQTGGMDREAAMIEALRAQCPHLLAIEVGAWTDPYVTPNERLKTDYVVKALCQMRFGVFNVTPYDLAFGTTYPRQLSRNGEGRLLAANLVLHTADSTTTGAGQRLFDPYAIVEIPRSDGRRPIRVGIIGATDPASIEVPMINRARMLYKQMPEYDLLNFTETLQTYVPQVRQQADFVIVLAAMNRTLLLQYAQSVKGIDLLVSTWAYQMARSLMRMANTWLFTAGHQSRYFCKVVVEFDDQNRPVNATGGSQDIPASQPPLAAVTQLLEQYRADTQKLERRIAVERSRSRFAGRSMCLGCHRQAYLQWVRTPHNLAFATLVQKRQHFNPDCLKCHVTAYAETDGFVDNSQTGHLVSVQCEVCHGPARAHVTSLTALTRPDASGVARIIQPDDEYPHLLITPPASVCERCHDPEHDPDFNYEKDLPLVSHQNPLGPFRRPKKVTPTPAPQKTPPVLRPSRPGSATILTPRR